MSTEILSPFPYFTDRTGNTLNNGYVYIGEANKDPELFPQPVFWDAALTIPASQPLRTVNGYVVNGSSPAAFFTGADFSIRTKKSDSTQAFYRALVPDVAGLIDTLRADLASTASDKGAGLVGFSHAASYDQGTVGLHLKTIVSVMDAPFNAIGDGVVNDWEACQRACDYVQEQGGGIVIFPPGKTFRIAGNTIVIWGNNVSLMGYGATVYKDNSGGSAGYYGDAITIYGKVNGNEYNSPQVAGTYTTRAVYTGPTEPSVNIKIEGFTVTFGTHSSDTVNGISGINFEHVSVSNCVVSGAPQTAFAWIASEALHCLHLTMDNCLSDGSAMQAFRFNSYTPDPGEMIAKVINCRSENTGPLPVSNPWPEQYGLPSSVYARASGSDVQYQVAFDNCQFDATTHLLDGYRTTSFRNCRMGYVLAVSASPSCALQFDNCRFRAFNTSPISSGFTSQFYGRNTYNGAAKIVMTGCTFETPGASQYVAVSYGFDLSIEDPVGGAINYYHTPWDVYLPALRLSGCMLKNATSAPSQSSSRLHLLQGCTIRSPLDFSGTADKIITLTGNHFVTDSSFTTNCLTINDKGSVDAENNLIEYTDNAVTPRIADPAFVVSKTNTYLYDGGTERSFDVVYGGAVPTDGYWQVGSRVIRTPPAVGQPKAWVCTASGAPGTWVSEGNL